MARTPTTQDPFSAVAEPKRRHLLEMLGTTEQTVNGLVQSLGWPQPMVSKHLKVLKQVGLVSVRRAGRQRFYSVNPDQLKPIHDWVFSFAQYWKESHQRLDEMLEALQTKEKPDEHQ